MSIKIKQQKLIDPSKSKKKKRAAQKPKAANTAAKPQIQAVAQSNSKPVSKSKYIFLILLLALAIFTPKPQLIKYQKLGVVTQSIYWPGFLFFDSGLLDSNLSTSGDIENNSLYICDQLKTKQSCQKYQVIEKKGFIASIQHYLSH